MSQTTQMMQLSNTCQCYYCETCEVGVMQEYGGICEECGEELTSLDYCDCDCWEVMVDVFTELFNLWQEANGNPEVFHVEGSGMGWRSLSGHSNDMSTVAQLLDALEVNTEYRLQVTFDPEDNTLRIVRTSHDEMGALFVVQPYPYSETEQQ